MEQFTVALFVLGVFWLGVIGGWLAMRVRIQGAYERARADGAAEQASLKERLEGREKQVAELRESLDAHAREMAELREQLKHELGRRTAAEERNSQLDDLQKAVHTREERIALLQNEMLKLRAAAAELATRLEAANKTSDDRLKILEEARQRLTETFQALSADALQQNNQAFLLLAGQALSRFQEGAKTDLEGRQKAIEELVRPLKESLEKVDVRIHEIEKDRVSAYTGLTQQVQSLVQVQSQLQTETSNLVNALRTPTVRGRWGEIQLRRVVEVAGMVEYCDFTEQESVNGDQGRLRPDMIVKLPNDRQIVVDAKVSLSAYLEALEAETEEIRRQKLAQHAQQVKEHLVRLSAKNYTDEFKTAPEFVVAFLPGEIFFSAALQQDPTLIEFGAERKVILATPTTLIALLKAVAFGWRQEKISRNAAEIRDLGKQLYERLRTMAGHFDDIQISLEKTNKAFNRAVGTLESRVMVSARRLKDLGAGSGEEISALELVDSQPRALQSGDLALLSQSIGEEPGKAPSLEEIVEEPLA
jgi:DNA recombination protein RmuC